CQWRGRRAPPAKPPAQRKVDVARGMRDRLEMDRNVVECVAENRPQELGLWMIGLAQQLEPFRRVLLLQDADDQLVGLAGAVDILRFLRIEVPDRLAFISIEA